MGPGRCGAGGSEDLCLPSLCAPEIQVTVPWSPRDLHNADGTFQHHSPGADRDRGRSFCLSLQMMSRDSALSLLHAAWLFCDGEKQSVGRGASFSLSTLTLGGRQE